MDDVEMVHGLPVPGGLGITEDKVEALTRLPARKDDIFIVSYPRSGSTWTQEIVWQIIHDGKVCEGRLDERVPFIEGMILPFKSYPYAVTDVDSIEKMFSSFPVPRVFKTHLQYHMIPKGHDEATKPRYIYVMRNPKDAFVSRYHHFRNMPYLKEIPTWDNAFGRFMTGKGTPAKRKLTPDMDKVEILHDLPVSCGQGITEEKMDALTRLPARKDDIFIVSYPRSGSTWTQEIVWQIIHDGKISKGRLDERMPFIEGMIAPIKSYPYIVTHVESIEKVFTSFPEPRVFKTNLPYDMVPKGHDEATKPRYIYVMRNPKDAFVSRYHHFRNMPYLKEIPTWDEAFERLMKGKALGGVWFDHVLSWWKHRDDPNILFLTYEDRIKDPADAVEKIAKFIDKEISPETRDLIVQQTTFGAMKSSEHTNFTWFDGIKGDGFIRKGQVGEWKNFFTEEQNELFNKVFKERMEGTGIAFDT